MSEATKSCFVSQFFRFSFSGAMSVQKGHGRLKGLWAGAAVGLLCLLVLAGCRNTTMIHHPATGVSTAPFMCVVENANTQAGFLNAIETWFKKQEIAYQLKPHHTRIDSCEWTIAYRGWWEWEEDTYYLSDAEIFVHRNGEQVGQEILLMGTSDETRFEEGELRIHKLMDMLYGKEMHYTPTE